MQVAVAKRSLHDGLHCGDACGSWRAHGVTTLCIVDGLGHGELAEHAAKAAIDYVESHLTLPIKDIVAGCNAALRHTRGAAMGIAIIDDATSSLSYAGIGNTRAMVVGEKTQRLISSYGIVGGGYKPFTCATMPMPPAELMIMFTDGLPEFVDISKYDDLQRSDVRQLADCIMNDWHRSDDDAAVLVFRKDLA